MNEIIKLSDEKFKEIYTDQEFRNNVAFAHVCCDAHGTFQHRKTCSYPIEYIVTDDQIKEATNELNRAKNETFELNKNNLLFVGMGMYYSERYFDDVCNHRVRTEFLNSEGKRYFIEVGTGRGEAMRCDHSIDRDLEMQKNNELNVIYDKCTAYRAENKTNFIPKELSEAREEAQRQTYNNFAGLERTNDLGNYTKTNLLELVNRVFNCKFKSIVIDNYNIHCDDKKIICESPKN